MNNQLKNYINQQLKKFKRRKVYARLKDNIWAADLTEFESLSSKNKNVKYLLCIIDVFTKYAWVKPLKDKKGETVLNGFIEIVMNLIVNQINYGLIKEENFTINLCNNAQTIMLF